MSCVFTVLESAFEALIVDLWQHLQYAKTAFNKGLKVELLTRRVHHHTSKNLRDDACQEFSKEILA